MADKPTPKSQKQLEHEATGEGYINSKPEFEDGLNRGTKISQRGTIPDFNDTTKDFKVGLYDIDASILYYFQNVIKPDIVQDGNKITVPVRYASPERWNAVQENGFYRDKEGKLLFPIITVKRISMEKNRNVTNKLDANFPHNYAVFEKTYSQRNSYDNFSLLTNTYPTKELHGIIVPDYVTLNYECVVITNYIEQMNPIVESINFASDSYWGDPQRFKFRARIDNFTSVTELVQDNDRAVKSTFNIMLSGYIIPDTINADIVNATGKFYSKSKVVIGTETVKKIIKPS
jgi:hypothetical protein